jgi:uncharacterized membrane protein YcaP (DUF421 family)
MDSLRHGLDWALGLSSQPGDLTLIQVSLRAAVTYLAGLLLVRLARNRFLARETAFDIVLGFVLGSVLSRGVNGAAPLFVSLAGSAALVVLHQVFAVLSFRYRSFERAVNGRAKPVIVDGRPIAKAMRLLRMTPSDLEEALRIHAHGEDPGPVAEARVERNGDFSVIPRHRKPHLLEVRVEHGVQTVRIEIH